MSAGADSTRSTPSGKSVGSGMPFSIMVPQAFLPAKKHVAMDNTRQIASRSDGSTASLSEPQEDILQLLSDAESTNILQDPAKQMKTCMAGAKPPRIFVPDLTPYP